MDGEGKTSTEEGRKIWYSEEQSKYEDGHQKQAKPTAVQTDDNYGEFCLPMRYWNDGRNYANTSKMI